MEYVEKTAHKRLAEDSVSVPVPTATKKVENSGQMNKLSISKEDSLSTNNHSPRPTLTNASLRRRSIDPTDISILVVDNDKMTLKMAERMLTNLNYSKIRTAESGTVALEILSGGESVDIVLSDIHMPGMNGFQLAKEIKAINENICILMMSGADDLDTVYQSLRSGADHYILKPLKESDLAGLWQPLYRKRKEKAAILKFLQEQEAKKCSTIDQSTNHLKTQVEQLKDQVERAVEAPVRIIANEIQNLLSQTNLPAEIFLATILRNLRKVDIYTPVFQKLVGPDSDLEPISKRWLADELAASVGEVLNEDAPFFEWPTVDPLRSVESRRAKMRDWNFDVWSYPEEDLLYFLEDMFQDFSLMERFHVSQEAMRSFLLDVNRNYSKQNPYHNFRHAFDVTQTIYLLLTSANAASVLDYVEIFSILVAGIVHDLGHPGFNNAFQIATGSHLAFTHNDTSVLENFHCNMAFTLLSKPENDIFARLKTEDKKRVRTNIIKSILATDLNRHVEIMGRWNSIAPKFNKDEKEHRNLLLEMLLKAADLANPLKVFDQAKHWAVLVQEEFFIQGDREKQLELNVSAFMDRDAPALEQLQLNFIDFLVIPLWESLVCVLPSVSELLNTLKENRTKWELFRNNPDVSIEDSS